jgi:hypothetical protein
MWIEQLVVRSRRDGDGRGDSNANRIVQAEETTFWIDQRATAAAAATPAVQLLGSFAESDT